MDFKSYFDLIECSICKQIYRKFEMFEVFDCGKVIYICYNCLAD